MLVATSVKNDSFVALDHNELHHALATLLPNSTIRSWYTPSRSRASLAVGGGQRTLFRIATHNSKEVLARDSVYPMVQLRDQSYPGAALRVDIGLYRLVCSNGLMALSRDFAALRIPHFPARRAQLAAIADTIHTALSRVDAVVEQARALTAVTIVDPIATVDQLLLPVRLRDSVVSAITNKLHRAEDIPTNAWGLYNIINEADAGRSRSVFAALDRDTDMVAKILATV